MDDDRAVIATVLAEIDALNARAKNSRNTIAPDIERLRALVHELGRRFRRTESALFAIKAITEVAEKPQPQPPHLRVVDDSAALPR